MVDAIKVANDLEIIINKDAIEPDEYFQVLKGAATRIDAEHLQAQMNFLAAEKLKAERIGQKNFAEWLDFSVATIGKELALASMGINNWVNRSAVATMIDKVTPRHSVKIIELDRFPRMIPDAPAAAIEAVVKEGIFDGILVVFTDLTKNDYKTPAEREFVARNRDPVAFGYFKEQKSGEVHHRLYHIADWADSECDLSFDKLLDRVDAREWGTVNLHTVSAPLPKDNFLARILKWMRM